jgi:hypothetical protein
MVPVTKDLCKKPKLVSRSSLEGLCPEMSIMFSCQIFNSTILAWRSEEYVHDLFSFSEPDMRKDQMFTDTMGSYNESGKSLLLIKLRDDAPIATITCLDEDTGCSSNETFRLLGMYH